MQDLQVGNTLPDSSAAELEQEPSADSPDEVEERERSTSAEFRRQQMQDRNGATPQSGVAQRVSESSALVKASAVGSLAKSAASGNVKGVVEGARNTWKFYTAFIALFTLVTTIPSFFYLNYYILRSLAKSPKFPAGVVEKVIVGIIDGLAVIVLFLVIVNIYFITCMMQHYIKALWYQDFSACV